MPDYIFLTYDRADRSYVDSLVQRLAAERIGYWIDHDGDYESLTPDEQLAGAAAVVVVVSPAAVASPRIENFLRQARELGKPILPLVRRQAGSALLGDRPAEDVTAGGMPSPAFYDRIRGFTGRPRPSEATDGWEPRTRLPHRLGPIPRTAAETWAVRALLAATGILAVAALFAGRRDLFLVFPAFGIPDLLFAWFRWRRFRLPGRWSTDVRATILLTGLSLYLAVVAVVKLGSSRSLLIGVPAAVVLSLAAATVWIIQAVRDRPPPSTPR